MPNTRMQKTKGVFIFLDIRFQKQCLLGFFVVIDLMETGLHTFVYSKMKHIWLFLF